MEKAGILTLYYENYNFGGLLQAYALPKILNTKFKHVCTQCQARENAIRRSWRGIIVP